MDVIVMSDDSSTDGEMVDVSETRKNSAGLQKATFRMPTIDLPSLINDGLNEFLAGRATQACAVVILISALAGWSLLIWRARVRIQRRIRAAVAAYAALELPQ